MHNMQNSSPAGIGLVNATAVGRILGIDPTTVYRMAADGRLPAVKVGRQWRFQSAAIAALLGAPATAASNERTAPADPSPRVLDLVSLAQSLIDVSAQSLGVMMVVTDMSGTPLTTVVNPCPWFAVHAAEPTILTTCIGEWRTLADDLDLAPRFTSGPLGFECARAFVRDDHRLVAMVLAGGVAPARGPAQGFYRLDPEQRDHVLDALPRIASALSRAFAAEPHPDATEPRAHAADAATTTPAAVRDDISRSSR